MAEQEVNTILADRTNDHYETCTGFTLLEVQHFAKEIGVSVRDLSIVLIMLHSNLTALMTSVVARTFGWLIQHGRVDQIVREVSTVCASLARHYKPESRFRWRDPNLPGCFSIVDGVPIMCRGGATYYNDKNGQKSIVFQVICTLAGNPISWSEGTEGSRTDAFAFDGWQALPTHNPKEFILGDSMYSASAHVVTPWKVTYKDSAFTDNQKATFEMNFRKVRGRVEHLFARLDRHAWTAGARQQHVTITNLFNLLMHMEARREHVRVEVQHYDLYPDHLAVENQKFCDCGFASLETTPLLERNTSAKRHELAVKLCVLGRPLNKSGSKSKMIGHYFALTHSEKGSKFKKRKAERKEELEVEKKERRKDLLRKHKNKRGTEL